MSSTNVHSNNYSTGGQLRIIDRNLEMPKSGKSPDRYAVQQDINPFKIGPVETYTMLKDGAVLDKTGKKMGMLSVQESLKNGKIRNKVAPSRYGKNLEKNTSKDEER